MAVASLGIFLVESRIYTGSYYIVEYIGYAVVLIVTLLLFVFNYGEKILFFTKKELVLRFFGMTLWTCFSFLVFYTFLLFLLQNNGISLDMPPMSYIFPSCDILGYLCGPLVASIFFIFLLRFVLYFLIAISLHVFNNKVFFRCAGVVFICMCAFFTFLYVDGKRQAAAVKIKREMEFAEKKDSLEKISDSIITELSELTPGVSSQSDLYSLLNKIAENEEGKDIIIKSSPEYADIDSYRSFLKEFNPPDYVTVNVDGLNQSLSFYKLLLFLKSSCKGDLLIYHYIIDANIRDVNFSTVIIVKAFILHNRIVWLSLSNASGNIQFGKFDEYLRDNVLRINEVEQPPQSFLCSEKIPENLKSVSLEYFTSLSGSYSPPSKSALSVKDIKKEFERLLIEEGGKQ